MNKITNMNYKKSEELRKEIIKILQKNKAFQTINKNSVIAVTQLSELFLMQIEDRKFKKPTIHKRNNLPLDIKVSYNMAIDMVEEIYNYENGIVDGQDFILEIRAIKARYEKEATSNH